MLALNRRPLPRARCLRLARRAAVLRAEVAYLLLYRRALAGDAAALEFLIDRHDRLKRERIERRDRRAALALAVEKRRRFDRALSGDVEMLIQLGVGRLGQSDAAPLPNDVPQSLADCRG